MGRASTSVVENAIPPDVTNLLGLGGSRAFLLCPTPSRSASHLRGDDPAQALPLLLAGAASVPVGSHHLENENVFAVRFRPRIKKLENYVVNFC